MSGYTPNMYGTKKMTIVKFIVQETGTFNQQWRRPMVSGMSPQTFNQIVEKTTSSKNILASNLAGIANQFLHPSATPEGHLVIPNGWQEKRLRFFMEVQVEQQMGYILTEYITGYTDYFGLGMSNSIDPQMQFVINGVNITRSTYRTTVLGNQAYQNTVDASHVLSNTNYHGIRSADKQYSLRPEDVFMQMDTADLQRTEGLSDFVDTSNMVTAVPIKSKRSNNIAPVYVAGILDSYVKSHGETESRSTILDNAIGLNRSSMISEDSFMSKLKSMLHNNGDKFSYNDLMSIDPNVQNVTIVMQLNSTTKASLHQTGLTADWGSANAETVFATSISQTLPGYMLEYCINKLNFRATNRDLTGKIVIEVIEVKSLMQNVDLTDYIKNLLFKIETELLMDLSYGNQIDFAIEVKCDLIGETWINLSINSGPFVMYVTPSFCDALMSPMITNNQANSINIASDFNMLLSHICDNTSAFALPNSGSFGIL